MPSSGEFKNIGEYAAYIRDYPKRRKETIIELKRLVSRLGATGKYTLLIHDFDGCVANHQNLRNPEAFCAWTFKLTIDALGQMADKIREV